MQSGWAVMADTQVLRGWCVLLPETVVPTINDLALPVRTQFLSDMATLGDALLAVTGAAGVVRINYAIFCNAVPELHAHVVPRYADEPEDRRMGSPFHYPVEAQQARPFDPERDAELMQAIRSELRQRM